MVLSELQSYVTAKKIFGISRLFTIVAAWLTPVLAGRPELAFVMFLFIATQTWQFIWVMESHQHSWFKSAGKHDMIVGCAMNMIAACALLVYIMLDPLTTKDAAPVVWLTLALGVGALILVVGYHIRESGWVSSAPAIDWWKAVKKLRGPDPYD